MVVVVVESLHFKGRSSVIGGPYRNLHESPKAEGSVNSYGATSLGFWKRLTWLMPAGR